MNERIKILRKELNMTLEKFGKQLGVGKTAINKLENGVNNITDQMVKSICREFNVREDWLRNGCGSMFEPKYDDEFLAFCHKYNLNKIEYSFLENYLNLNENERKSVLDFITHWLENVNINILPKAENTSNKNLQNIKSDNPIPFSKNVSNMSEEDIQRAGEEYMQELRMEKNRMEKSKVSS